MNKSVLFHYSHLFSYRNKNQVYIFLFFSFATHIEDIYSFILFLSSYTKGIYDGKELKTVNTYTLTYICVQLKILIILMIRGSKLWFGIAFISDANEPTYYHTLKKHTYFTHAHTFIKNMKILNIAFLIISLKS